MQASSAEVESSFEKAVQAFRDVFYPASKQELVSKAEKYGVRSEVLQAIENLPDREYISSNDAIGELESTRHAVITFTEMEYPMTKVELLKAVRNSNVPDQMIETIENCPETRFGNAGDVLRVCRGAVNW
jgi:hypothetical protein